VYSGKVLQCHSTAFASLPVCQFYCISVILPYVLHLLVTANVLHNSPIFWHPDDGGDTFLRNICSYKSPTSQTATFFILTAVKILHSINRLGSVAET
jgi:hypothetical protein